MTEKIGSVPESQQQQLTDGMKIKAPDGRVGIFGGIATVGDDEYIKIRFEEEGIDAKVPKKFWGTRYLPFAEEATTRTDTAAIPVDTPPEDIQKFTALKKLIRDHSDFEVDFDYQDESQQTAAERILVEAKQSVKYPK